jgi:protein-disulfide isomerase
LPKLKAEWIGTGKAKPAFRDFPFGGAALKAAMLARCAPADKFDALVDVLFQSQDNWKTASDPPARLHRIAPARRHGDEQFQACMQDDALQNKIVASRMQGEREFKVESTPTFIINRKRIVGAQPYQNFEEVLKSLAPKA